MSRRHTLGSAIERLFESEYEVISAYNQEGHDDY